MNTATKGSLTLPRTRQDADQNEYAHAVQVALYKRKANDLQESSYYRRHTACSRLSREAKSWTETMGEWMEKTASNAPLSLWLFKDELIQKTLTGQRDNSTLSFVRGVIASVWMVILYVLNVICPSEQMAKRFDDLTVYSHVELIIAERERVVSYTATQSGVRNLNSRRLSSQGYDTFYDVYLTQDGLARMKQFLETQARNVAPFDASGYTFYYLPYPFLVLYKWFKGRLFPETPMAFTCSSLVAFALIHGGFLSPDFEHVMSGYGKITKGDSWEEMYVANPYITSPQLLEYLLYDAHSSSNRVSITYNKSAIRL